MNRTRFLTGAIMIGIQLLGVLAYFAATQFNWLIKNMALIMICIYTIAGLGILLWGLLSDDESSDIRRYKR